MEDARQPSTAPSEAERLQAAIKVDRFTRLQGKARRLKALWEQAPCHALEVDDLYEDFRELLETILED